MRLRKRFIILFVLAVILIIGWNIYLRRQENKPEVEYYIAQARSLIEQKEYGSAVEECTEGLKLFPDEVQLYMLKARAYGYNGEYTKAAGILDYGYKRVHDDRLRTMKSEYVRGTEGDVYYLPPDGNPEAHSPQENPSGANYTNNEYSRDTDKAYTTTAISDVYLPEIIFPETTAEEVPETVPEEQPTEEIPAEEAAGEEMPEVIEE